MTMCETCRKKAVCKDFSDLEFDVRLCEDYEPEELKHVGGGWYAYKKENGTYSEPFIWKGRNNMMRCPFRKVTKTTYLPHTFKNNTEVTETIEDFAECYRNECAFYQMGKCQKICRGDE